MSKKSTCEELKQEIKELEKEAVERNRTMDELRAEKVFSTSLIENAPMFFVAIDSQGKTLMMNRIMLETLGLTSEDVIGKDYLSNFVPERDRELLSTTFKNLTIDHKHTFNENHIVSKDGKEFLLEWRGTPVFDASGKFRYFYGIGINITRRRQTEKALRKSEEKYRTLVETMYDGLGMQDEKGIITYVNDKLCKMLGYSQDEITGQPVTAFLDEANRNVLEEGLARRRKRKHEAYEIEWTGKDERKISTLMSPSPLFDLEGNFKGSFAVIMDISEHKQAKEALLESEEKYKNILENIEEGYFEVDLAGNITFVNDSVDKIHGYPKDEFMGMNNRQYTDEENAKKLYQTFNTVYTTGKSDKGFGWEIIRKDGSKRYVEASVSLRKDSEGQPIGFRGIVRDITERKQAEEKLRESEERDRTILEASPDPIVIYDMDGNVIYFNPAFARVFGWTLHELIGRRINFVPDEAWSETLEKLESLKRGESFFGFETKRLTKKGDVIDISMSFATWRNREGVPVGSVVILHDTTEQKKLEAQLQQAQRMEALGTLGGGIAHDFNNLLMGIQGRTSLMMMDTESSHPHFEHLKGIEGYVKSAADLTKQLLGFARGGKYEVKPTDINEMIKKSSGMFSRTKKEIKIHRKYQKDVWSVETDQGQIEQVLLNLYVNAWQAMPGGGELYLQTENVTLDEDYVKPFKIEPGKYVKISVTDTGVGMDEATRQRIFDPFFTTKEMGRGSGLGLASAYGIIKNHGGFINVYSEKGEGTTFNFYLPASESEVRDQKSEVSEGVRHGDETVLLVDDENMIIDVGGQLLEKMGYTVLIARSGKEAIDIYEKNKDKIDLIILDMIMPGMSGGDTFDRLKQINPEIKVLLSSGYSINGQATEILERGCDGFIQKPFNMKGLSQKLREILDKE